MFRSLAILAVSAALSVTATLHLRDNPEIVAGLFGQTAPTADHSAPAVPAAAPRSAEAPPLSGRRVRLDPDPLGHHMAEFRLNGRRIEGLVDTGATVVAINRTTARRIGLTLAESDFVHEVTTANGRTRAAAATIDRLEIGRIRVDGVQAMVLDDRALTKTLVGMSFLGRLRRFHVERGAMVLEQ